MEVSIKIENLDKLQALAEKYPAVVEKYIGMFITKSLALVYGNMAQITPVNTARLREDLHIPHVKRFEGYMGTKLPYAGRVHNMYEAGTPYRKPAKNTNAVAGFLTLAAKQSKQGIDLFCNQAIGDTLKEISF